MLLVRVAQLDRALGYEPRCRGFESSHAREKKRVYETKVSYTLFSSASADDENPGSFSAAALAPPRSARNRGPPDLLFYCCSSSRVRS